MFILSKLTKVAVCREFVKREDVNVKANTSASEFLGRFHARLLVEKS